MNLNELIKQLQAIQEKEGNIPVKLIDIPNFAFDIKEVFVEDRVVYIDG